MALTDEFEHLGPNSGLIEEMYRPYEENPESVSPAWRDFFADYTPRGTTTAAPAPTPAPAPPAPAPAPTPAPATVTSAPATPGAPVMDGEAAAPIRGAAARIVENMESSL